MVDAITLFESNETSFSSNGIGSLPDATSCIISEERNGAYELSMEYPITGHRYEDLKLRRIIFAKPNPYSDRQPFRIYKITKPINGIVKINAEHVRYDLAGYIATEVKAYSAGTALNFLFENGPVSTPFTGISDIDTTAEFVVNSPVSVLSQLGGTEGSVLDTYGGEYEWDKFTVKLWESRGEDRGVTIRYGKNLTDLSQEENCANVFTGVYPYWKGNNENNVEETVTLQAGIVEAEGTFDFVKIATLDLSSVFQSKPTEAELAQAAALYMSENKIGVPEVALTVSFIQLSQTDEYANYKLLETVKLCDTVTVQFEQLGVDATAKVISTEYDALTDKYTKIELGETKSFMTVVDTIASNKKEVSKQITKSVVEQIASNTSRLFNGCFGGYVRYNYVEGQEEPYEILIMDHNDLNSAKNIWRWNYTGLAFSNSGYNGPWLVGMNMLGEINGNLIAANTINGNCIESGTVDIASLREAEQIAFKSDLSNISGYYEEGQLWMHFDNEDNTGLWIGRLDSQFLVNITNQQMAFVQNDGFSEAIKMTHTGSINPFWILNGRTQFLIKTNSVVGNYLFRYNSSLSKWTMNGIPTTLEDYGVSVDGTPANNDTILIELKNGSKDGRVVAYVSNNKLLIKDAQIQEQLGFGKSYDVDMTVDSDTITADFSDSNNSQFLTKINFKPGTYIFEYSATTFNKLTSKTWNSLGAMTWTDMGLSSWYYNGNPVSLTEYGITVTGTPVDGDTIECQYDGTPVVDYAFVPNTNGSLKFKWIGKEEETS